MLLPYQPLSRHIKISKAALNSSTPFRFYRRTSDKIMAKNPNSIYKSFAKLPEQNKDFWDSGPQAPLFQHWTVSLFGNNKMESYRTMFHLISIEANLSSII